MDPDDHFDLACVYGLALAQRVKLLGVLCDSPPPGHSGDPDVAAVAMLNHLTGLSAPLVVGASHRPASRRDTLDTVPASDLGGVRWLLETLRGATRPAYITVVGSCRDVALAARRDPCLFARKCRGIFLNAGAGSPDTRPGDQLEYNVALDPGSYASMFDAPCPIYWMPCFERVGPAVPDAGRASRHGTFYKFTMGDLFARLSPPMQRYFLSMLEHESGSRWLRSLHDPVDPSLLARWSSQTRAMWCTAGFLHLAGLAATAGGAVVPTAEAGESHVCRFAAVQVACDDAGHVRWRYGAARPPRFKFEVTDPVRYGAAMAAALRHLIGPIGRAGTAQGEDAP
jgi:hypothetical protein